MKIRFSEEALQDFLDEKSAKYEQADFILSDPIVIPHQFAKKADIEISAFLTAVIAWGNRKTIIQNGNRMMALLDHTPYDFVCNHSPKDLKKLKGFVHRTFNADDFLYFLTALQHIYKHLGGLEQQFKLQTEKESTQAVISRFKQTFFSLSHPKRTQKHIGDPQKGSATKRINMFLRWMVRPATRGVDFGIWQCLSTAQLSCPLDVHSGKIARKIGLLKRKQNDAKAVIELDKNLRKFDPIDPVKYDFALFGLGVFENF